MYNMVINAVYYCVILALLGLTAINAQTTEFSYQGSLKISGAPASGIYDFEFRLFDAASGGTQVGSTVQSLNIAVANGIYAVTLDFGASELTGADRYLDIAVRTAGGGAFSQLAPRQKLLATPYSVKSLSSDTATNFAGTLTGDVTGTQSATVIADNAVTAAKIADLNVTDAKITDVAGSKITGTIPIASVPAGSGNYIQNTNSPQAASNFNISGTGTANIFNAATQYNIGGSRILGNAGTNNLFAGNGAGSANTSGIANSFFGSGAGTANTLGVENSFFGHLAGSQNTEGGGNSFFGDSAGNANLTGQSNTFVGRAAGMANSTGGQNSFFGYATGLGNIAGGGNSFFGRAAGNMNTTGNNNTALGNGADFSANNLSFATAIGAHAVATASNRVQLGRYGGDTVSIGSFLSGGSTSICAVGEVLAYCSSSRRLKKNVEPYSRGLTLVNQLQPITFDWKDREEHDIGLIAEDVAAIEPLLVTLNAEGNVEGIKYDRISVALVNAVKEQQGQIEELRKLVTRQSAEVEQLKQLVCSMTTEIEICRDHK